MTDERGFLPSLPALASAIKLMQEQVAVLVYEEEKLIAQRLHIMTKLQLAIQSLIKHTEHVPPCAEGDFPELNHREES